MATQNLGMGAPSAMRSDWNSYFDSAKPGSSQAWGGGTLTMGEDGQAKYAAQGALNGGTVLNRNSIDNPNTLQSLMAQAPGIAKQWGDQYGVTSGLNENDQNYWNNMLAKQGPQGGNPAAGGSQGGNPYMQTSTQTSTQPAQSAQSSAGLGMNPWLQQQGQALQAMSNQNLKQNILPGIGQGAQAAGMYGSSRQGIAEGQAIGNAQTGLNSALANMYSQSYGQDQQYALGNKQADNSFNLGLGNLALGNKQSNQSYDLGLRNNDLGFGNLDANINQQNFNNQMAGANFGLGIYDRMNGYNAQGTANGTQMQNTPLNYFNQFNNNTMAAAGTGSGNQVAQQGSVLGAGIGAGLSTYGMMNPQTKTTGPTDGQFNFSPW